MRDLPLPHVGVHGGDGQPHPRPLPKALGRGDSIGEWILCCNIQKGRPGGSPKHRSQIYVAAELPLPGVGIHRGDGGDGHDILDIVTRLQNVHGRAHAQQDGTDGVGGR